MQLSAAQAPVEERGVYWAPYSKGGLPVLYSVKANGDRLQGIILQPSSSADEAIAFLWKQLNERDPVPVLRLVKDDDALTPPRISIHDIVDGFTWTRMQHDAKLRARVIQRVKEIEKERQQNA